MSAFVLGVNVFKDHPAEAACPVPGAPHTLKVNRASPLLHLWHIAQAPVFFVTFGFPPLGLLRAKTKVRRLLGPSRRHAIQPHHSEVRFTVWMTGNSRLGFFGRRRLCH
jgi:hypothetical protein